MSFPQPSERESEAHQMEPDGTVLLVDDQDAVRDMAESMLKRPSYEVLAASGGAEAVKLLCENPDRIRCVITDLAVSGLDGGETLAAMRKIQPHIPAIPVNGYDEAQVMTGNYSEQSHVFLHKPYSKSELFGLFICRWWETTTGGIKFLWTKIM
jgi:CheY-like chemotaxis protein